MTFLFVFFGSGAEKGVNTKGVFSLEESLESLNSLESLENGRILLCFPQSGGSLVQKTPFSDPDWRRTNVQQRMCKTVWSFSFSAFSKPCLCLSDTRHFRHFRRFRGSEERSACFQWVERNFAIFAVFVKTAPFWQGAKSRFTKNAVCATPIVYSRLVFLNWNPLILRECPGGKYWKTLISEIARRGRSRGGRCAKLSHDARQICATLLMFCFVHHTKGAQNCRKFESRCRTILCKYPFSNAPFSKLRMIICEHFWSVKKWNDVAL